MSASASVAPPSTDVVLAARALSVGHGNVPFVKDLDLEIRSGEILALLGSNGAGKTTTLMGLSGLLRPMSGHVEVGGLASTAPLHRRSREGVAYITQERCVFTGLSVRDNLRVGGVDPEEALEPFPELLSHMKRRVGLLSGGQQQMLAVARALARRPAVMLADELSLGLAPMIVDRILQTLVDAARDRDLAVVLVEQQITKAMAISDRTGVLRRGRLELMASSDELLGRLDDVRDLYL
ncbi:ABC transporter ATP-binding protein [Pseudonocardia xishanensis]|uniref:ABC transporter ATP-binding protein n=1 Tax=Pseudonocardia xishanensis TaxID=630995 RepID=A0ABP8RPP4_9PSEU